MPDDIDTEQEGLDPNIREALRHTKQLAQDKAAAEQRTAQLERELAFTKAGVPDSPLTTTLAKSYDGDNDPTAIKAYFEGLGVDITGATGGISSQQTPNPAQQGATEEELAEQRRLAQAAAGGDPGGAVDFAEALASASSAEEVQRLLESAPAEARVMNKTLQ
jgi:hypothetical protein